MTTMMHVSRMEKSRVTVPDDLKKGEYHVFLAHSSQDVAVSIEIRDQLEGRGVKCFHSDRDFQVHAFNVKIPY